MKLPLDIISKESDLGAWSTLVVLISLQRVYVKGTPLQVGEVEPPGRREPSQSKPLSRLSRFLGRYMPKIGPGKSGPGGGRRADNINQCSIDRPRDITDSESAGLLSRCQTNRKVCGVCLWVNFYVAGGVPPLRHVLRVCFQGLEVPRLSVSRRFKPPPEQTINSFLQSKFSAPHHLSASSRCTPFLMPN
jgi:hypothetical protein